MVQKKLPPANLKHIPHAKFSSKGMKMNTVKLMTLSLIKIKYRWKKKDFSTNDTKRIQILISRKLILS
jgi:hypothetical protein